jgi:HD-like signal output (HDOD) protein
LYDVATLFEKKWIRRLANLFASEFFPSELNTMIQNVQTAKRVLDLTDKAHNMLMESLELVRTNCSRDEYKMYQAGMAHVVGNLFFLVMQPIYCQHTSLIPPDTPQEFVEAWARNKPLPKTEIE